MVHADVCHDVCSFISAAKFPSSLGQVPLFKFRQCEDYSEQSKPYFEPCVVSCLYGNKDLCFPSPCIVSTTCGQSEIKHQRPSCCRHVIKELVLAFSCASIELWMHLGSLENTQEARVALGYRLEKLLRFFRALQTSRVHP